MSKDKELFKKTEGRLYRYFKDLQLLDKFRAKLNLLNNQQKQIEKEIKDLKELDIEGDIRSIDYSADTVQSTKDLCGAGEKETIRYINKLEREYSLTIQRQLETKGKVRDLEYTTQDLRFCIEGLTAEERMFIELKYKECQKIDYISTKLFAGVRSTTFRKREELVWKLA